MALDPQLSLGVQVQPIGNQLLQGYQAGSQIRQQREEAPLRNRMLTAQAAGAEQQQQMGAQKLEQGERESIIRATVPLMDFIQREDEQGARMWLSSRKQALQDAGKNTTQTDEALQLLDKGGLKALSGPVQGIYREGIMTGVLQEPEMKQQSLTGDVQLAREMGIDLSTKEGRQEFQQFRLGQRHAPQQAQQSSYFTPVQTGEGVRLLNTRTGEMTTPTGATGAPLLAPAIDPDAQAAVVDAKTSAKIAAENRTEKEALAGSDAINLFTEFEDAIKRQPATSAGRTYEGIAGRVGAGSEEQQIAIAQADTIASQLMAYANKLPGPASDKDRIDFKASIGAYEKDGATRAQKLAAVRQANASFQRLIDKYGKETQKADDWTDL